MADTEVLSASKITIYKGCPLSYYFIYVYPKVYKERLQVPQSPNKIFGSAMHEMLYKFYRKPDNKQFKKSCYTFKSKDSFIGTWKMKWWRGVVKDAFGRWGEIGWHSDKEPGILYGTGVKILSAFYEHNINLPYPVALEKSFREEFRGQKMRGVFDRIEIKDDRHFIIDYKTDMNSPENNPFILHRHPQFTLYSAVYEQMHKEELGGKRPVIVELHLRSGRGFETKRSEEDYDYLESLIGSAKKGIGNDEFTPFYGFHCGWCEYLPVCKKFCINVGAKLRKLELISDVEPIPVDWISFENPLENQKTNFDRVVDKLPKYLSNFLLTEFENFFNIEEMIAKKDPGARKLFEERKEAIGWVNYTNSGD